MTAFNEFCFYLARLCIWDWLEGGFDDRVCQERWRVTFTPTAADNTLKEQIKHMYHHTDGSIWFWDTVQLIIDWDQAAQWWRIDQWDMRREAYEEIRAEFEFHDEPGRHICRWLMAELSYDANWFDF